ncbi:hypothetical protein HanPI659440_Chr03g0101451 [Helianthus annuus]|nr:hypothetical protein HanPI659440_Chr03g0101451 [Helianthus annuus]
MLIGIGEGQTSSHLAVVRYMIWDLQSGMLVWSWVESLLKSWNMDFSSNIMVLNNNLCFYRT